MSVCDNIPDSYLEANEMLTRKDGAEIESKALGYKTSLHRLNGNRIALKHHFTRIVLYHGDGSVTVDTHGWHSPTTKRRINAALGNSGWGLYAHDGEWRWHHSSQCGEASRHAGLYAFEDGDRIFLNPEDAPGDPLAVYDYTIQETIINLK